MTQGRTTETTPLLPPPPITADASAEARLDGAEEDNSSDNSTSLSTGQIIVSSIALASLIFLQATNMSIITTTQGDIAKDLEVYDQTSWFSSAYLIAMSSAGPLNGKLAAVLSPRTCILMSSVLLALGTLVTGSASDFSSFIVGRVITGLGGAGVFTVSIILVLELSSIKRRGLSVGLLNTGYTVGVASGAVAAGAALPVLGWRYIFLGQTPIALLGGIVLFFSVPNDFSMGKRSSKSLASQLARLDYLGAITLTTTIVLVLYSLSSPKQIPLIPLALSPVSLAAFLVIEVYYASDPIIPVTLLRSRGLLLSCLATVGYMMARWSVLFYTPIYAISLRSWSPAVAGTILIPTNGGFALGGLLVGWLHIRRGGSFYRYALAMYALFPLTLVWLANLVLHDSSIPLLIIDLIICGFVTGAALNYNLAHVLHLTPKSTHYMASSLLATFRGFSGSFGSAIGGGLFTRTLYTGLVQGFADNGLKDDDLIHSLLGAPALVQSLTGIEREVAISAYESAFQVLFMGGTIISVVAVFIQAGTGWRGAPEDNVILVDESSRLEGNQDA